MDRWLLTALLLLLGLFAWGDFTVQALLPVPARPHWPETSYWVVGRLALEGHADRIYAGPAVLGQESIRLGTLPDIFEPNPPTTVLLLLPFALVDERTGYRLWVVFSLACFGVAWALLLRALRLPVLTLMAVWAVTPLFQPLHENINWGQAYLVAFG
ncbi:MAG TPA: glycosyltransferase 87 family protein, partial [Chloroflexia bacterium]|nr:glycosyltransferase 87 family protein [Chloroflexia bacterium]